MEETAQHQLSDHLAQLKSLNDQYCTLLEWTNKYEKIRKQWVEELARLNNDSVDASARKYLELDQQLEKRNKVKAEKVLAKDELAQKIETLSPNVFAMYGDLKRSHSAGDLGRDHYISFLRSYKEVIETGGGLICYCTYLSKEVRDAIKKCVSSQEIN